MGAILSSIVRGRPVAVAGVASLGGAALVVLLLAGNRESPAPMVALDVSAEDVRAHDVSAEDVSAEDVSAENVSAEDVSAEDVSAENLNAEHVSAEHVSAEHVSAEDVIDRRIVDEWNRAIRLPPPTALRACTEVRRARALAARLADDEYYLARARRLVPDESWKDPVRRRIAQLEKRLRRDRASLSRLRKPCRRQIEAWVASRHKSGIVRCDPYIDPLCCP